MKNKKNICLQASGLSGESHRDLSGPELFSLPAIPEICETHWAVSILPAVHEQQGLKFCLCLPPPGPWLWQIPEGKVSGVYSSFERDTASVVRPNLGFCCPKARNSGTSGFYGAGNKGHQSKEKKGDGELG